MALNPSRWRIEDSPPRTWRRDPAALALFAPEEMDRLTEDLDAIARGDRMVPPVVNGLREVVADRADVQCVSQANLSYTFGMAAQLVTRVPDALVDAIDQLIKEGRFMTRSEAVREGLETVVERARRAAIGTAIVAGYLRVPQDDDESSRPDAAAHAMIAEEEW